MLLRRLGRRPSNRTSRSACLPFLVEPTTIGDLTCLQVRQLGDRQLEAAALAASICSFEFEFFLEAAVLVFTFKSLDIYMFTMIASPPFKDITPTEGSVQQSQAGLGLQTILQVPSYWWQPHQLPERNAMTMF